MIDIESKVITILKQELLDEKINSKSSYDNTNGWDSQFFLVLIMVIEEDFEIAIPNDKLDKLTSVYDITQLIKSIKEK